MATQETRRRAFVTGGTGAVGSATCRLLAQSGHDLTYTYRSNAQAARALTAELVEFGGRVEAVPVDLGDESAVIAVIEEAVRAHGGLDTVIHAAGPHIPQNYVSALSRETFVDHVHQELMAFHAVAQAVLPVLRESRGSLVAVTTVAVRQYPVRDALSATPKAAIEALVRAIAAEEGRYGIRANCVGPGILADGIGRAIREDGDFPPEAQEFAMKRVPLRRFGLGAEVAEAAVFLSSERAAYITGQSLDVDGGFSI